MGLHEISFNYNTQVSELKMPEYGRNVQDLVDYCKGIRDDKERQGCAEAIVELMQIITPYNKNYEEHRKKLWHHLFRIADYKLDVTPPYELDLSQESDIIKPSKIEYPKSTDRYRHYGAYINNMVEKAKTLDDQEKKEAYAKIIANYMKTAFKNWNKEHFISDESIKDDLATMSKGELRLNDEVVLEVSTGTPRHIKNKLQQKSSKNKFKRKNKNNNNNNNNNRRRY